MSKYAPRTRQIERQGVALIATVFSALGHNWNENQVDVGIDGWVELVKKPKWNATPVEARRCRGAQRDFRELSHG